MRVALTLTILLAMTASAQQPRGEPNPAPRFNVLYNERFFPQTSPKAALASAIKAADLGQFDYIAAYLMDEAAADALIAAKSKDQEAAVVRDLRTVRAQERADPFKPAPENRLPLDPVEFGKRVQSEATRRGFDQLSREVRERFEQDPSHLKDMQRFLREGDLSEQENAAKLTLKSAKGQAVHFKKVGAKWFLEDRREDTPAAAAPATTKE